MLMSSSKLLFLFSKKVHFNSVVRLLLELHCVVVIKHVAFYFGENNSGIYMYQFTFDPLNFCFQMWLWFRIWATNGRI